MSVTFIPTFDVLSIICAQAKSQIEDIDNSVIFDGPLQDAIDAQFGQSLRASVGKAILFAGMSVDQPLVKAGSGAAIRSSLAVDLYIAVRKRGVDSYLKDVEKILTLSDRLVFEAFDTSVWGEDFKSMIGSMSLRARTRQDTAAAAFAHRQTWDVVPLRKKK